MSSISYAFSEIKLIFFKYVELSEREGTYFLNFEATNVCWGEILEKPEHVLDVISLFNVHMLYLKFTRKVYPFAL